MLNICSGRIEQLTTLLAILDDLLEDLSRLLEVSLLLERPCLTEQRFVVLRVVVQCLEPRWRSENEAAARCDMVV